MKACPAGSGPGAGSQLLACKEVIAMSGMLRIPRSRGALSGVLLVLLGTWGGLIAFVGPYFHYAYTGHPRLRVPFRRPGVRPPQADSDGPFWLGTRADRRSLAGTSPAGLSPYGGGARCGRRPIWLLATLAFGRTRTAERRNTWIGGTVRAHLKTRNNHGA